MKPYLQNWITTGRRWLTTDKGEYLAAFDYGGDEEVLEFASAAPVMCMALLSTEWSDDACPGCGGLHRGTDRVLPGHWEGCWVDGALTAAGLPDQGSRDIARKEIGL